MYAQVVGIPGDVIAVPWEEEPLLPEQWRVRTQQQQVLQGLQYASPESKVVSRGELLVLLQRLLIDKKVEWQEGPGRRLKQQQQQLQNQEQQQQQREEHGEEDSELKRLLRLKQEHNEQQEILHQHISELWEQQEQQKQSDMFYLLLRVPPGRCWLESFEVPRSDRSVVAPALPSAAATIVKAPAGLQESDLKNRQDIAAPGRSVEVQLPAAAGTGALGAAASNSFLFGLLPLALVEGLVVLAAPAPGLRPRHQYGGSGRSSPMDDGGTKEEMVGWLASLFRLGSEVVSFLSLPAALKPVQLPELKDMSPKGTRILVTHAPAS